MHRAVKITKNKKLNKGFSLVELIVSMAILAIVGAAIIAFFSIAMVQYKNNTNETNVQTESRMAWKRLESNILQTTDGIWAPNESEIWLFNTVSGHKIMTRIYFDKPASDGEGGEAASKASVMKYEEYNLDNLDETSKVIKSLDGLSKVDNETQVFANFVTNFSIKLYDKKGNEVVDGSVPGKVVADISYKANEKTYESNNIVAIRNDIVASNNIDAIYE
ncbi:MAG: prepilin-type N-terminal cleavage/methylation domain-containing protein [Lachnospiraceae bacterium]|nr:prepilin-type N-terminal cleavage/methylation domain-containing protein [Lachnospiraceae bacterium]